MSGIPDITAAMIRIGLAMLAFLSAAILLVYYTRRRKHLFSRKPDMEMIDIVARRYVGPRQWLLLIEVAGTHLLLGLSRDRIKTLTTMDEEAVSKWRDREFKMTPKPDRFSDQLLKMIRQEK